MRAGEVPTFKGVPQTPSGPSKQNKRDMNPQPSQRRSLTHLMVRKSRQDHPSHAPHLPRRSQELEGRSQRGAMAPAEAPTRGAAPRTGCSTCLAAAGPASRQDSGLTLGMTGAGSGAELQCGARGRGFTRDTLLESSRV